MAGRGTFYMYGEKRLCIFLSVTPAVELPAAGGGAGEKLSAAAGREAGELRGAGEAHLLLGQGGTSGLLQVLPIWCLQFFFVDNYL